jgi:hypothetical protein
MIPYWEQQVVRMPDNMYATFYRNDFLDKAICIFYNDGEYKGELRLTIDWKRLDFEDPSRLSFDNVAHTIATLTKPNPNWSLEEFEFKKNPAEYVRLEGDEIVFPMTPYNYRMIVIEQR